MARKHFDLQCKIEGDDAKAGKAPLAKVAEMLSKWSAFLEAVAGAKSNVRFVGIGKGSLVMKSRTDEDLAPRFALVSHAVTTRNLSLLPDEAPERLLDAKQFADKAQWKMSIVADESHGIEAAVITDLIDEAPPHIVGDTTIVGRIRALGGEIPTLHIALPQGGTARVRTDEETIRALGKHIYQSITADVDATWNAETMDVIEYRLRTWRRGPDLDLVTGITKLSRKHGKHWKGIDSREYVRRLRGDDDE